MPPNDERILVLAPTGEDAPLICDRLAAAGLAGLPCRDLSELADAVLQGAAAALIAQEALEERGLARLLEALGAQPPWSDLPIAVLADSQMADSPAASRVPALSEGANLTLLERPLRVVTLVTTVQAALRARRRQYEFRDYLREYERYQEQVRHTQKLESLGVLAGGIAHDFNNLLTGITGNVSLAADLLPPSHEVQQLLQRALASSERAARLTSQMLAYSGKGQFFVRPVKLPDLIGKLNDFFRASIAKRVELEFDFAEQTPTIEGDESQLEQVVMNLVLNAAEAIPDGRPGRVAVSTGLTMVESGPAAPGADGSMLRPGAYASLRIADDGIGMDEPTLQRIFDPFFTTKFTGRGLGLAAVQGIVRGHRGDLRVESRPGAGTTFTILFPASGLEPLASSPPERAAPRNGHATVLVVDDEEIVRRIAAAVLERNGYSPLCAENGGEAVRIVEQAAATIDLVLLDMTMPVMDGDETLRALQRIRPGIRVVLSSGYNEAEALRRFTGRGLAGFIQKPYTNTRLLDGIRRALESGAAGNLTARG